MVFTVAAPLPLKDDSRFAKFGSSLCLPQAASYCIPLHLRIGRMIKEQIKDQGRNYVKLLYYHGNHNRTLTAGVRSVSEEYAF